MARNQFSTALKIFGAGAVVIAGGAAFGYLFGSAHLPHPAEQTTQPPASATLPLTPAPKLLSPSAIHPHTANGNYTAPGAPRIVIEEERQPILRRVTPPPAAADSEATQEATTPPSKIPSAQTTSGGAAHTVPSGTAPSPASADSGSPGNPGPATPTPPSPPPAPADPDFEHVNTPKPGASDPESGQQGGSPPDKSQTDRTQTDSGSRAQFRVQTGAYTDESNARSIADTLRSEGYSASTRSERDGDHLVYKVQVGAYRSKDGANKAADSLQKKGYPAFISPMTP